MTRNMSFSEGQQLAMDTIMLKQTKGIPSFLFHVLKHSYIDMIAGEEDGGYLKDPVRVYIRLQENVGTCLLDQWIPENPLSMTDQGYTNRTIKKATTGAEQILCDGMIIESPEDVVEHLEKHEFPKLEKSIREFDETVRIKEIIEGESYIQNVIGSGMLKTGYGFVGFPRFRYGQYGYVNYFCAYGLYPEVIEKDFKLQSDYYMLNNKAAAKAYNEGCLPPLFRLDHDMADSRGTFVNIKTLDKIWFNNFARCIEPLVKNGIKLIWHTDGNMMEMVPRLIEVGVKGFQGFQYECGMNYEKLASMTTKDGENLILLAGISSTDGVLRNGTPDDVRKYLKWIVSKGPATGLFISSMGIYPDMPWENVKTYVEGIQYYRKYGRTGN